MKPFWCFYCYHWTDFKLCSSISIVDFEQVNIACVGRFIAVPLKSTEMRSNNHINLLWANTTKSSNTLKQLVGKLPTNCLSVFDHFLRLVLKGLKLAQGIHFLLLYESFTNKN